MRMIPTAVYKPPVLSPLAETEDDLQSLVELEALRTGSVQFAQQGRHARLLTRSTGAIKEQVRHTLATGRCLTYDGRETLGDVIMIRQFAETRGSVFVDPEHDGKTKYSYSEYVVVAVILSAAPHAYPVSYLFFKEICCRCFYRTMSTRTYC